MNAIETEPGVYSVLLNGASFEVRVLGTEVMVNGHRFETKRSSAAVSVKGPVSITASMPGKVVRLLVGVGDSVVPGQSLIVVEAMKMQNELKATRTGRVAAIRVQPNQSVNAGMVLLTLE